MKILNLVRHAKSSWDHDSLGDRERPLSSRGLKQLAPMGHAVRAAGVLEGPIFCSSATRARQTLEGLVPEDLRGMARVAPVLYTFNYQVVLDWLMDLDDGNSITLIGHNPALQELATYLLPRAPESFPTCAFMQIVLPIKHWRRLAKNTGRLEQFLTPVDVSYTQFKRKRKKIAEGGSAPLTGDIPEALQHQYQRLRNLETGVILGFDDEFLHQYRIAIRRSRAIAESVNAISSDAELGKKLKALKKHARATGRLRDLHVFLADLERWQLNEATRGSLVSSGARSYFTNLATEEHRELVKRLSGKKYRKDMEQWHCLITSNHFKKITRKMAAGDIRRVLCERIDRYNGLAQQLTHDSPDDHYHSLRKLLKRIRYLAELDKAEFDNLLAELKHRQQRFGDFQDLYVQISMLSGFRDTLDSEPQMMESVAGLNTLISGLVAEKERVRGEILTLGEIDGHSVL